MKFWRFDVNNEFYERMSDLRSLLDLYRRLYEGSGHLNHDPLVRSLYDRASNELSVYQDLIYQAEIDGELNFNEILDGGEYE